MTRGVEASLAHDIGYHLAQTLPGAPDEALRQLAQRSGDWESTARWLASEVKPEDSKAETEALCQPHGATASTWRMAMPVGIYTLTMRGELIGLPAGFEDHVKAANHIEINFVGANGGNSGASDRMVEILRARGVPTHGHVIDRCCSAHVDVLMACSRRTMSPSAKLMIHARRRVCFGTFEELASAAEELRTMEHNRAIAFAARCGQPVEVVREWFRGGKNFWFNSESALKAGLVDAIAE